MTRNNKQDKEMGLLNVSMLYGLCVSCVKKRDLSYMNWMKWFMEISVIDSLIRKWFLRKIVSISRLEPA